MIKGLRSPSLARKPSSAGLKVTCAAAVAPALPPPATLTPSLTYKQIVESGASKATLSPMKTFLMAVVAGVFIALGGLLALSVGANCPGLVSSNPGLQKIIFGMFGLPLGLLLVLMTGMELFTGNTASLTAAVLEGRATVEQLAKNWICSYFGNLLGALIFVGALGICGATAASNPAVTVASAKTSLTFIQAFTRGIFANWLVCLAVWMATASSTLSGKVVGIFIPISSFVVMGFEHSVANMFLIPFGFGFMQSGLTLSTFFEFVGTNLLPVTLGNIVGGAICLAGVSSLFYGKLGGN